MVLAGLGIGFALTSGDDDASEVASSSSDDEDRERETTTTRPRSTTTTVDLVALQADFDAGVAAACAAAVAEPLTKADSTATSDNDAFKLRWRPISGSDGFSAQVSNCAVPQREARRASECGGSPPVELMNRDPESFAGQCFTMVFRITQFDQGTGRCTFRANFDSRVREYNFEYLGENALVAFDDPCPQLNPIGVDDVVRLRVAIAGGLSYDTTMGGSATAVDAVSVGGLELLDDN